MSPVFTVNHSYFLLVRWIPVVSSHSVIFPLFCLYHAVITIKTLFCVFKLCTVRTQQVESDYCDMFAYGSRIYSGRSSTRWRCQVSFFASDFNISCLYRLSRCCVLLLPPQDASALLLLPNSRKFWWTQSRTRKSNPSSLPSVLLSSLLPMILLARYATTPLLIVPGLSFNHTYFPVFLSLSLVPRGSRFR